VYVGARDLAGKAFIGTHQFTIIVPDNPAAFSSPVKIGGNSYSMRDLGNGIKGFVIGAHNVNGRLMVKVFEASDYQATLEYYNPKKYTKWYSSDFDTEIAKCSSSKQDTQFINDIFNAVNNYILNENKNNISYPALGYGVNSNSWAQSVIDAVGGHVRQNFSGVDWWNGGRVPGSYFLSPVTP